MPDETKTQDNADRLLAHLKENSLAVELVRARVAPDARDPKESMKAVLLKRLAQVRQYLDGSKT